MPSRWKVQHYTANPDWYVTQVQTRAGTAQVTRITEGVWDFWVTRDLPDGSKAWVGSGSRLTEISAKISAACILSKRTFKYSKKHTSSNKSEASESESGFGYILVSRPYSKSQTEGVIFVPQAYRRKYPSWTGAQSASLSESWSWTRFGTRYRSLSWAGIGFWFKSASRTEAQVLSEVSRGLQA